MKRLDVGHADTPRMAYQPDEAPDDQFDLTWSEWRWLLFGTFVALVFVLGVTFVASGT